MDWGEGAKLLLVQGGLHSRHRAMTALGVEDPALEAARIGEERGGVTPAR